MTGSTYLPTALTVSVGILLVRIVFGSLMAAHGSQKLLGWFGGHGLDGTAGFFEALGFRPGKPFAVAASATEVAGGLLVLLGLFGPIGPALVLSVMIVAAFSVHWKNGVFAQSNGVEVPLLYGAAAAGLALTGPGLLSLDALFSLEPLWRIWIALVALALGVLGGLGNLTLRRPPQPHGAD